MAATVKIERLINQVMDALNFKYAGSCVEQYDSNHDAYIKMTLGGAQVALIKCGTVPQGANALTNTVTGLADVVYVPDVVRVGIDGGTGSTDFFTMVGATAEGAVAKGTLTGTTVIATNTATVNGVVFTAVASGATANQFNIGANDTATMANLAAAINASVSAGVLNTVFATSATNVVTVYSATPGTGGNALTLSAGQASIVASGANFTGGTAGSTVVINGVTFTSVKHADYVIVVADSPPQVGPGTLFFDEGAGTAAQAAVSVAAVINASTNAGILRTVTAAQDGVTPAQVDLTAYTPGTTGNSLTLSKTGTLVTSVNAANFSGGVNALTPDAVLTYVAATCVLLGTEVRFYTKSAIAITDLTNEALFLQSFNSVQWGFINQQ